jgi:hypothetical protein
VSESKIISTGRVNLFDCVRGKRFGGQPYFNDFIHANYKDKVYSVWGEKNGKALISAMAGSYVMIYSQLWFQSTLP